MAGATMTGAAVARYSVVRKLSAMPRAILARVLAVAGAITSASNPWDTPMCSTTLSTFAGASPPNMVVITSRPVKAAKVSGAMNSCACRVITTWTSSRSCCNRRTSSAALYAATPPLTPSTTRMGLLTLLFAALAVFVRGTEGNLRQVVLKLAGVKLFHGHARGLVGTWIGQQRHGAQHQLPGAPAGHNHIGKQAVGGLIGNCHEFRNLNLESQFRNFRMYPESCASAARCRRGGSATRERWREGPR